MIVDDDRAYCGRLEKALDGLFAVDVCHDEEGFRDRFALGRYDLIMMDLRLRSDREGIDLLREIRARDPFQASVVMTAYADMVTYAEALDQGASTYLDKREFSLNLIARIVEALALQGALRKRVSALERQLDALSPLEIIGASAGVRQLREALQRAAQDGAAPVLIAGESGSGRRLLARNIHRFGRTRSEGPFADVDLFGSSPEAAARRVLGGTHHGADGRVQDSTGLLDDAKGGVAFVSHAEQLDEQGVDSLVRVLATGKVVRVGGSVPIDADVQLILSVPTQADGPLAKLAALLPERHGGFCIRVPPLRERRDDIPLLAQYGLQLLFRRGRTRVRAFRATAVAALEDQSWPGNVRELFRVVEYAAILADAAGADEIGPEHLPRGTPEAMPANLALAGNSDYQLHLARAELGLVESAIRSLGTDKKGELAERLRYHDRFTFVRRVRRCLDNFPDLKADFPATADLFSGRPRASRTLS